MPDADIYKMAFNKHGESPKSLHWINYASQAVRFKHLVADLELENKTILDAGCGLGDVLPFIYAKANRFDYIGVDINPNFIEVAKKRYAGHKFQVGDPFSGRLKNKYDVIISSGVLNHNIPNWLEIRKQMILILYKNTGETLAFNMAGAFNYIPPDSKIAYADAQEILDYCSGLCPNTSIKTGYSAFDFTITMPKEKNTDLIN